MSEYRGWSLWSVKSKQAPNFGGMESWREVRFRKGDEEVVGASKRLEDAYANARGHIDFREDGPPPDVASDSDIPF